MRALQKLVKNGNATSVTIPRVMLLHLDWLPGQAIIVEETEDRTIHIRRPNQNDFGPVVTPRILFEETAARKV